MLKKFQGEVRAGKKEYENQRAKMYGPYDKWHHIKCFVENRVELEYFDSGEAMGGFMTLSPDDQAKVRSEIKVAKRKNPVKTSADEPDGKKIKVEDEKEKEAIKKQMKKVFYYRDLLERHLKKAELTDLLEVNKQEVPTGVEKMLDRFDLLPMLTNFYAK
jgi:hypothetical protein